MLLVMLHLGEEDRQLAGTGRAGTGGQLQYFCQKQLVCLIGQRGCHLQY